MKIKIAERLKPFSHTPGVQFLLPGSQLRFQIFPTKIFVHDLSQNLPQFVEEIDVPLQGPVEDFTVLQDLEKGLLHVWGKTPEGFVRYRIERDNAENKKFHITFEKHPSKEAKADFSPFRIDCPERLSLGNHKAQDWDLLHRRCDMTEILPLWLRLGTITPTVAADNDSIAWLTPCREAMEKRERSQIISAFKNLYRAGFDIGLSPRSDERFQGYSLPGGHFCPLILLTEGAKWIRRLFIQSDENKIIILPVLPPEFHAGRLINIPCPGLGTIDFEWSKHLIRRMIFHSQSEQEISFHFQKETKQFRLRERENQQSKIETNAHTISSKNKQTYLFDNFQK